ncbi:MAG: transglycosylase domain-containing protein, partial [Myxococcales bacterium]|nr:transglycosylase domain-containing protein [Myxococcales bacterium]
ETLGVGDLVSGALDFNLMLSASDRFQFQASLSSDDLTFFHPMVSPLPIEFLPFSLQSSINFDAQAQERLRFAVDGRLGEDVVAQSQIRILDEEDGTRMVLDFEVEETDCQDLLRSIPAGFFVDLPRDEIRLRGEAGLDGQFRYTFGNPRSFRMNIGESFPGTCEINRMPRGYRPEELLRTTYRHVIPPEYTYAEEYVSGEDYIAVGPATRGYRTLEELPAFIPAIMYLTEQRDFYEDPAISLRLIERAVRINLIYGRWAYGASTVTQQLVKNLYFDRSKTLARKLQEAIVAWAVESVVPKDRILELYLNCIEFGPDVYGIEAAAQYYFNVSAHQLTPIQASYLAGLKPAPSSGGPYRERGFSPSRQRWQDRLEHHIQMLADRGFIDQSYVDAQESFIIPLGDNAIPPAEELEIQPLD